MSRMLPEGRNEVVRGLEIDIELEAVPGEDVVTGAPRQGIAELGEIGGASVGIWELRDGVVVDTEVDEMFVVLSGGAKIEFLDVADGSEDAAAAVLQTVEVGPGDTMRLVAGSRTRWSVTDHIRKVYIA